MLLRQTRQQPSSMGLVATTDAQEDEDGDSSGDGHSSGLFSFAKQRVLRRRSCLFMLEEVLSSKSQKNQKSCMLVKIDLPFLWNTESAASAHHVITNPDAAHIRALSRTEYIKQSKA